MQRMTNGGQRPSRGSCLFGFGIVCLFAFGPAIASAASWRTDYPQAKQDALTQGKPLLVTITASWCGACRQMDQLTFTDSRVRRLVDERFVAVSVNSDHHPEVVSAFGVSALPTTLVILGSEPVKRWTGFQEAASFARDLEGLATGGKPQPQDEFAPVSAIYPSNSHRFGFAGFCLVSLLDNNILRRGEGEFTAEHQGVTVCFHTAEHRDRFVREPQKYWPVANGTCLVTSREQHAHAVGDPRVGVKWRGKLWFFADRTRQQQFMRAPHRFAPDSL
ncbi:MAG TPA: thioredoxin family protein [Planctomycetaceae bacterium]|nr:thioredoxin family protein [Planctomycetaceae bacterium]